MESKITTFGANPHTHDGMPALDSDFMSIRCQQFVYVAPKVQTGLKYRIRKSHWIGPKVQTA